MSSVSRIFIVNNIKLPIDASYKEAFSVAIRRLGRVGVRASSDDAQIFRRSVDARDKTKISFVYSVSVSADINSINNVALSANGITILEDTAFPKITYGAEALSAPPVIVGSGPAGMFSALLLAEHGYRPILLERGGSVAERVSKVESFVKNHTLDAETNIQFGAGGAGTFSDGKLITRINDPISSYVLKRLVEFGAPQEITYLAKPHIGTDVLSVVVDNVLRRIEELGGRVLYHTRFEYPEFKGNNAYSVMTNNGSIESGALILAIGHSARDTYKNLMARGFSFEAKSFSVGMRIEHLTSDIDKAMYGDYAGHSALGHAEYSLSHNTHERGVYTFCMCPGGEVVAATSEELGVVVNGMSNHKRDGRNSNSAVCCSVFRQDYGSTPEAAIEFQRKIEHAAYIAGGGEYCAPLITVGDFLDDKVKSEPTRITPTYMNGTNYKIASPSLYLPQFVTGSIKNALINFDKKLRGFATRDAVLTGAETRTSAPVRILRDPNTRLAIGFNNVYPAGEGAGYAGGITSAAVDGIRTAIALMEKFKP